MHQRVALFKFYGTHRLDTLDQTHLHLLLLHLASRTHIDPFSALISQTILGMLLKVREQYSSGLQSVCSLHDVGGLVGGVGELGES